MKKQQKLQELHDQAMALHDEAMRKAMATCPWTETATTKNIHVEWDCTKKKPQKKPPPTPPEK